MIQDIAQASPILQALLRDATHMSFYRFCELLDLSAPNHPELGTTDSPADDAVYFRSCAGLGFPGRDIQAIEIALDDPAQQPVVRTTFLGLYGVDARMPSYFVDEIAQHREGAEALAAFLDIFHHRVVTQYFRIWRKYRYPAGFREGGRDTTSDCLMSLAGLGFGSSLIDPSLMDARRVLSMLGVTCQRTRTAEGLASVLRQAIEHAGIEVHEFHPIWVDLHHPEPMPIGENCVLGRGFIDRSNGLRVTISADSSEVLASLMPGKHAYQLVMQLLRFYIGYEAQVSLELRAQTMLMPAPLLTPGTMSLGYTSMLKSADNASVCERQAYITIQLATWNKPSSH